MGDSTRDVESEKLFNQMKGMNPNVNNLFANYKDPFSTGDILKATDAYTKKGIGEVGKQTATGIKRAAGGVGRRFAGAGVTKGSIFEDAVAGAEGKVRESGSNQIGQLLLKQLALTPGILNQGNQSKFRNTQSSQNVLFGNKANEFNKFGNLNNMLANLDDDTWFDDILEVLNTGGNIAGAITGGG
jgi:hypothetical protein